MKKIYLSMLAAVVLASCSDNDLTTPQKPLKPGSEVSFTLSLDKSDLSTRTTYGDYGENNVGNAFPVYWVNNDKVAMASPGAAVDTATYSIEAGDKQNYATSMTKVGAAGIQWGSTLPQSFYSVYPTGYVDVNNKFVKNSFTINGNKAEATLHVRDTQKQLFKKFEVKDSEGNITAYVWKGTPVDENEMKSPDAIMYAQKKMEENGDVILQYVPFTTAFNITLDGYEYLVGLDDETNPIVIQEVIIEAPEGTQLVGDFKAAFDENATATPVVTAGANINTCKTPNIIHIPCMVDETNYLHPAVGEKIVFNVFAIPTNNTMNENWKLHVKTNYKTYTRSLKPATGDNKGTLVPGKVHKLGMPAIKITVPDETTLPLSTWMQYIPRNVYITDLSLPGAWYSRQKEYQGQNGNSDWTINALWQQGVRAFSVETRTYSSYQRVGSIFDYAWVPTGVAISGTGYERGDGAYSNSANITNPAPTRLSEVIDAICTEVSQKKAGYAVLMISYADGGNGGHRADDYSSWLKCIKTEYDNLSETQKAVVYGYNAGEEITPSTTIGDVAGRLIIQINVASGLPGGDISKGNYAGDMPALLTYVNRKREAGTAPVSMMHWKEWSDDYMQNVGIFVNDNNNEADALEALQKLGKTNFYCNYSMANRTYPTDDETTLISNNLPTYTGRKQALSRILRNSALSLQLGNHNLWSTFAAGGTQAISSDGGTNSEAFAVTMNNWILEQLNSRIASGKYGPFGNVFCNYIATEASSNGVSVDGNKIIERILRMNQLFRLSRDEDKPEWPDNGSGTSTPSAASYSSTLSKDANGWNAY